MSVQFSYENQNQSSYLVATFPPSEQLINYQLQMMTSNDIKGLLPSMKRQKNEDILVYYNITSKISLSQIIGRKKLTRKEFLNLLEGAASAWKEIQEYQLEGDGICFQEDYIYVISDTCVPSFVYLPKCMSSNGLERLKVFIQGLIIKGVVETVSDNFIQELLNVMNDSDFSLEKLEECIEKFRGKKKQLQTVGKVKTEIPITPEKEVKVNIESQMPEVTVQKSVEKKVKKEKVACSETSGMEQKGKKKFLLFQALVMVCVAALISFGAFVDADTGQILVSNAGAVALVVAALEFVVYREIFVNSKKENEKKEKNKKEKKKNKTSHRANMEIPGKTVSEKQPVQAKETVQDRRLEEQPKVSVIPSIERTIAEPVPLVPDVDFGENLTEDATDFWNPDQVSEAYLEYIENGVSTKIPFMKESILVGRLRNQVDFPVNNARVGKMHAEFIQRDGIFYVQDLNSKNGTYINGSRSRINSNVLYPLSNGDQIHLADSKFVIHC